MNLLQIIKIGSIEELSKNFSKELLDFEKVILNENQLLIPGFVDCHTHAPQFPNIGLGLDKPLLEWLDKYTFPLESKYDDVNFAKSIYRQVLVSIFLICLVRYLFKFFSTTINIFNILAKVNK